MSGYVRVLDDDAEDAEDKKAIRRLADRFIKLALPPPPGSSYDGIVIDLTSEDIAAIIKAAYGNYPPTKVGGDG